LSFWRKAVIEVALNDETRRQMEEPRLDLQIQMPDRGLLKNKALAIVRLDLADPATGANDSAVPLVRWV
jgi:hypothetical protein